LVDLPIPAGQTLIDEMNAGTIPNFIPNLSIELYDTRRNATFWPWTVPSPYADKWASSEFTQFLVISGQIDWNTPTFIAQDVQQNIPGTELLIVPGAGHVAGIGTPCGLDAMREWIDTGSVSSDYCDYVAMASFQVPSDTVVSLFGFPVNFDLYDGYLTGLPTWMIISIAVVVVAAIALVVMIVVLVSRYRKEEPPYQMVPQEEDRFY